MMQETKKNIVLQIVFFLLNYLKYLPLTFFTTVFFIYLLTAFINTPFQETFIKTITNLADNKFLGNSFNHDKDYVYGINDFRKVTFVIWTLTALISETLRKIFRLNIKRRYWFILWSSLLGVLTVNNFLKFDNAVVFPFTYFFAIVQLIVYYIASEFISRFEKLLLKQKT